MISYLSAPYSDPDPKVRAWRHTVVNQVVYELMRQGQLIYSPLTHNIPIDQLGIHGNWITWKNFDHGMLSRCDQIMVLKLPGWENSKGVAAEIALAKELQCPIHWLEPTAEQLAIELAASPLNDLLQRIMVLSNERDWGQYHTPKNLSMDLATEAGEVMDHFRWLTGPQSYVEDPQKLSDIQDELGDVFIALLNLANTLKIDLLHAANQKLVKIAQKYPVDKCKGLSLKYTEYK